MRNIEARRLTEHVDVLQPKVTRDAVGGQVTEWVPLMSLWAEVMNARGSRMIALGDIELIDEIAVNIRWSGYALGAINERCRLKWQGRTYYLTAPPVTDRNDGCIKMTARRLTEGTGAPDTDSLQ